MKNVLKKIAFSGAATMLIAGVSFAKSPEFHHEDHQDSPALTQDSNSSVKVENEADVKNLAEAEASSGENHADRNHGDGEVHAGNASASITYGTTANNAEVSVTAAGCNECDTSFKTAKIDNDLKVTVENDANVFNKAEVEASTGGNTANCNKGDGSVTTGNASASVSVSNTLNSSSVIVK